jgi:hypothetical protein
LIHHQIELVVQDASKFLSDEIEILYFLFRRIHQFESFVHFEMSLIVDAFVMSLVTEHRRKSTPLLAFTFEQILERSPAPFLIAKCAECTIRKELGNRRVT